MKKKKFFLAFLLCFIIINSSSCNDENKNRIAVFYNDYKGEDSISNLREKLDVRFSQSENITFENYNASSNQKTQTEQIRNELQKGCKMILVNMADATDKKEAKEIVEISKNSGVPLLFFGTEVPDDSIKSYDKALQIGADIGSAGKIQGRMIGKFLLSNYELVDINQDSVVSYVMLKSSEHEEADIRTRYSIEETDRILSKAGKPAIEYYDKNSHFKYFADKKDGGSFDSAYAYVKQVLESYNDSKSNMIEVIISDSDDMALGAIKALQDVGYNDTKGNKSIPVFGIGGNLGAQNAIYGGVMTGTVSQDTEYMAELIEKICKNMLKGKDKFYDIDPVIIKGRNKIYVPYEEYHGRNTM